MLRQNGDRRGDGFLALQVLAMIAREQGQHQRALELFGESLALEGGLGDPAWTSLITSQIGFNHRFCRKRCTGRSILLPV